MVILKHACDLLEINHQFMLNLSMKWTNLFIHEGFHSLDKDKLGAVKKMLGDYDFLHILLLVFPKITSQFNSRVL